ncbi:MAG: hypothetical protein ACRC1P_09510 [Cellulosilyticaceae bacterium]
MMEDMYLMFKDKAIKILEDNWCHSILDSDNLVDIFRESDSLEDLKRRILSSKVCYCPSVIEHISKEFKDYNSDQCCYMYEHGYDDEDDDYSMCRSNCCWIEALDKYFESME